MKNINVPTGKVDVVIDTDAYNEIDDQFAISYLLRSKDKLNTVALYAAPFFNELSKNPCDGMEKSYDELLKIIRLCGEETLEKSVFKGSREYLKNENTPVISDAANDLVKRAKMYSPSNPLYVVAIAAITNIASAILIEPDIAKNLVIVWLGGHARHWDHTNEFNMRQDFAAARVIMSSDASVVQLPCMGVVSEFRLSGPDLTFWLENKNPLADYLAKNTKKAAEKYAQNKPWTRIIWDVTAVAWLLNENDRFMYSDMVQVKLPGYDGQYEKKELDKKMCYVKHIRRDALMCDMIEKLSQKKEKKMKYIVDNDLHIHSYLSTCSSDEEQTTERILKYAQDNDLKTICVTDHFWDDDVSGADEWYRRQNFAHISQSKPLPKADGIRFLFGCEAELSKDLKISIPRERFEDFDLVLISTTHFHKVGLTITEEEAATTESRVNAWIKRLDAVLNMDIPFEKVGLAHLTCGVIGIGGYENYIKFMDMLPEDELYRLFKKASKLKVGIELNRNDFKFDEKGVNSILKPYRIAKECGCKFYFGSDAHHPQAFEEAKDYFEFAVNILELTQDDKFII